MGSKSIIKILNKLGLKKDGNRPVYELKDKAEYVELNGKKYQTYYENNGGHWYKKKYKLIGDEVKLVYYKDSNGREYNKKCSIYEYKGVRVNFKK